MSKISGHLKDNADMQTYTYILEKNTPDFISFRVEDNGGNIVFQYEDEEIEEVGFSLQQMGYMENAHDLKGLKWYLVYIGIIEQFDNII